MNGLQVPNKVVRQRILEHLRSGFKLRFGKFADAGRTSDALRIDDAGGDPAAGVVARRPCHAAIFAASAG